MVTSREAAMNNGTSSYGYSNAMLGARRPLTWVRPTTLYDREYELSRMTNSDPDLSNGTSFSQRARRRNTLPNSPLTTYIRNFTWRLLNQNKYHAPAEGGAQGDAEQGSPHPPPVKRSTSKKPPKRWNMLHFVVGGQAFQCPEWIFESHPNTLLGNSQRRGAFYHVKRKCFIFSHILPDVFTAVLEYYQSGLLIRPERLTLNYFLEQLEMFDLDTDAIDALLKSQGVHRVECPRTDASATKPSLRSQIWNLMEYPSCGFWARIYCNFSLFMTVLSVVLYVIETLPELKAYSLVGCRSLSEAFASPLTVINFMCFVFFALEFTIRVVTCPSKVAFIRTWTNWTDAFSIVPYTIVLLLLAVHYDDNRTMPISVLNTVRACRLLLVTRVLGTSRYYRQHWIVILVQTLWNNRGTLFVLFFLMIICMIGFGGAIYAVEGVGQEESAFTTIPMGMWWAVVTMTTVGYGDVVPTRAMGQILAIICGCLGLIFIGFLLESVQYEYHRLMKTNSQYLRYRAEKTTRSAANMAGDLGAADRVAEKPLKRITSVRASMLNLAADTEVVISINGAEFLLTLTDLNLHPNSLLGHPSKRAQYFNPTTGSYFFPRNQDIFPSIHNYYRVPGSVLRRPPFITIQRFVQEIEFFQLRPQAVIDFFSSEGIRLVDEIEPKNRRLRYWHLVLEHPSFNLLANIISIVSMLATSCFTIMVILESLPSMLDPSCATALAATSHLNFSVAPSADSGSVTLQPGPSGLCHAEVAFFVLETVCTVYFLVELTARFTVSPAKRQFIKRPMNWVDVLVILPYIFTLIQLTSFAGPSDHHRLSRLFGFFRTMRLLRLVSILKFARYFKRLQMIFAILQSTWSELLMLCYFMLINSVIFGTLVYVVEANVDGVFNSIPRGMYWAWVTMLTIGYGDLIPESAGGKVVGAGCAILGIVFWTLPMTLISDHFANYRRLYESQEYLMKCLTRMYHLRDSESKRATVKPLPATVTDHDLLQVGRDSRNVSPRPVPVSVSVVKEPRKTPSFTRLSRHPSRSVSPGASQLFEEATTPGLQPCHFSRLQYDSGMSGSGNKTSAVTIGTAPTVDSVLDLTD